MVIKMSTLVIHMNKSVWSLKGGNCWWISYHWEDRVYTDAWRKGKTMESKDIVALNSTFNQLDLIDIYRRAHLTRAEYISFSSSHETFTSIDHILGHKTHLSKFKRIGIIQNLLSDHNGVKLEVRNRKIAQKSPNTWRLNGVLLNNTWVKAEVSREILKSFELNENGNTNYHNL